MTIALAVKHMLAAGMPADAIVAAVAEMEGAMPKPRTANAIRQERYRRNKALRVTENNACNASPSQGSPSPTPPSTPNLSPSKTPLTGGQKVSPSPEADLASQGVRQQVLDDWKAVRKAKRAGPITAGVVEAIRREAALAKVSVAAAVQVCVERGWQSFRHDYSHGLRPELPVAITKASDARSGVFAAWLKTGKWLGHPSEAPDNPQTTLTDAELAALGWRRGQKRGEHATAVIAA